MHLLDLIIISLRTLSKNKLRSGLTVLGVVIGIAAVTTMVSIGQGANQLVKNQFQTLGSNVIIVLPGRSERGGAREGTVPKLTAADADAIAKECPSVKAVSPIVGTSAQVIGGNVHWKPNDMQGVGPDYPIVRNWPLSAGQFFGERDVAGATKVCVIGYTLQVRLFGGADAIGQQAVAWPGLHRAITITLYDNRAVSAKAVKNAEGTYDVTLKVFASQHGIPVDDQYREVDPFLEAALR